MSNYETCSHQNSLRKGSLSHTVRELQRQEDATGSSLESGMRPVWRCNSLRGYSTRSPVCGCRAPLLPFDMPPAVSSPASVAISLSSDCVAASPHRWASAARAASRAFVRLFSRLNGCACQHSNVN